MKVGHWEFLQSHDTFSEDDNYFFCHAPIPIPPIRNSMFDQGEHEAAPFRENLRLLIWSYFGENLNDWVDPDPCEGKICVYGHIHGMSGYGYGQAIVIPGVRKIGNTYCIDTGCGCHPEGYLTALELPAKTVYTSRGEVYTIE